MSRGNPNQAKLVKELKSMGYKVKVKHNQIHIAGVSQSPFVPNATIESGYRVPDGETYGMTMAETKRFISEKTMEYKICPKCNGHGSFDEKRPGFIDYTTPKCNKCKGKGKVVK